MKKKDTLSQARDTGLAMSLLSLILIYYGNYFQLIPAAIFLLFLSMVWPNAFKSLSKWWFGLSRAISAVMSKVILTLLFVGIVTPVGFLRHLFGGDPMQFRKWKKGKNSVLLVRNGAIEAKDLEQPY